MSRNRLSREQNNDMYSLGGGEEITSNLSDISQQIDRFDLSSENIYKAKENQSSSKKHVSFLEDDLVDSRSLESLKPLPKPSEPNSLAFQTVSKSSVATPILSPTLSPKNSMRTKPLPPPRQQHLSQSPSQSPPVRFLSAGNIANVLPTSLPPPAGFPPNLHQCACDNRGSSDSGLADISNHKEFCPLNNLQTGSRLNGFSGSTGNGNNSPSFVRITPGEIQPRRVQSQIQITGTHLNYQHLTNQPSSSSSPKLSNHFHHASVPELHAAAAAIKHNGYNPGIVSPILTRKQPARYPGQQDLFNHNGSLDVMSRSSFVTPPLVEPDYQAVSLGHLPAAFPPSSPLMPHNQQQHQSRALSEFQTFRPVDVNSREQSFHSQDGGSSDKRSNYMGSTGGSSSSSFEYAINRPSSDYSPMLVVNQSPQASPSIARRGEYPQNEQGKVFYTEQTLIQHDMNMNQIQPVSQLQQQQQQQLQQLPQYKSGLYAHWLMNASLQPIKEECHDHTAPSI